MISVEEIMITKISLRVTLVFISIQYNNQNWRKVKTSLPTHTTSHFIMWYTSELLLEGYHANVSIIALLPSFN